MGKQSQILEGSDLMGKKNQKLGNDNQRSIRVKRVKTKKEKLRLEEFLVVIECYTFQKSTKRFPLYWTSINHKKTFFFFC